MELKDRVYTYPSPDEKQNIIRNKERNNTCKTKCSYSLARPRKSQYDPHHTHNHGKRSRLFSYFISQMPQKSPLNTIKYGLWLMFCNALICFDERTNERTKTSDFYGKTTKLPTDLDFGSYEFFSELTNVDTVTAKSKLMISF